jgi:ankyrin repeat protein
MTTTRRLLDAGANVDAMDMKRRTALEYAQAKGNKTMARLLLAAGATPRGENRLSGRATRATRWI